MTMDRTIGKMVARSSWDSCGVSERRGSEETTTEPVAEDEVVAEDVDADGAGGTS